MKYMVFTRYAQLPYAISRLALRRSVRSEHRVIAQELLRIFNAEKSKEKTKAKDRKVELKKLREKTFFDVALNVAHSL